MDEENLLGKSILSNLREDCKIPLPVTYHIVLTPFEKEPIFSNVQACNGLAYLLFEAAVLHEYGLLAFCIMPDHVHVLCRPGNIILQHFVSLIRYRFEFVRQKNGCRSSVWQPSYKIDPLPEEQIIATAMFIVENPVRNGIVSYIDDYPFSFVYRGKTYNSRV